MTCPAADAPDAEPSSASSQEQPASEPGQSLTEALFELTAVIDRQNEMLGMIVAQNADLMAMISEAEQDDEPTHDLSGKPIA